MLSLLGMFAKSALSKKSSKESGPSIFHFQDQTADETSPFYADQSKAVIGEGSPIVEDDFWTKLRKNSLDNNFAYQTGKHIGSWMGLW